jgi:hypothetical protein
MKFSKGKILASVGALLVPVLAFAQNTPPPITKVQQLVDLMCTAFDYLFYGLIALSIIMIVFAAFNYVTAGDNAEKVSKANKIILYAAIGIAVALIAKGVPLIVANFLSPSISGIKSC